MHDDADHPGGRFHRRRRWLPRTVRPGHRPAARLVRPDSRAAGHSPVDLRQRRLAHASGAQRQEPARAYGLTGDPYAEEPWCGYVPGSFPYQRELAALVSGGSGAEGRPVRGHTAGSASHQNAGEGSPRRQGVA
ncbi:hypothetical protein F0344_06480 [Streptomyces finlayi]|uniref:Uncharacterized protein n=1 Tax=Streptomyces finlayi TaxID=67296 RepID=A0A7G7BG36_9ACTN|nr:hypothetical protein [Streptomyces finlayi]QNE74301.1 hypothetical protein F0344_06480 [Streptomyces finlayi]